MKTINKIILTILTLAGLMFLSGCASVPGQTYDIKTTTSAKLQERSESMFRGEVFKVAPQSKYNDLLDAYEGDNERFNKIWGMSLAEAKNKQFIVITWYSGIGQVLRHSFLVDKKWDIQAGDIIDYLQSHGPVKTVVRGEGVGLCWTLYIWATCSFYDISPVIDTPGQILGIVCRNTEWNCRNDVSVGTTLGMGRKLLSVSEYRGVDVESQQPIRAGDLDFSQFWGINYCADCADDDDIIYVD